MSLLDKASLIVTPNAYEESKLYSVVPNTTLGDMDVVRATTATRVNSAGFIEVVPRNLFTDSEQIDTANWVRQGVSATANQAISPNGMLTAELLDDGTLASTQHWIFQNTPLLNSTTYTMSLYAKYISRKFIAVNIFNGLASQFVYYNIQDGLISGSTGDVTASITSVGNGWFRIVYTRPMATSGTAPNFRIALADDTLNITYTGSNKQAYVWGFQLENFTTATEYFPTTTRLNIPRIDYTNGSCPSILVEPQRTNLLTYNNTFSDISWFKPNAVITLGTIISPDGLINSSILTDTVTNSSHVVQKTLTVSLGQSYSISIYAKKKDLNFLIIGTTGMGTGYSYFNINNGTIGNVLSTHTAKIINANNGWYKCVITGVTTSTTLNVLYGITNTNGTSDYVGTGLGNYIYGTQVELGSYDTSLIPTIASTVTRNADVISKTGISSLIGQTEGTIFFDVKALANDNTTRIISLSDNSFNNFIRFSFAGALNFATCNLISSGTTQASNDFSLIQTNNNKIAIKYKTNLFQIYVNGVLIHQDLTVNTFSGTTLDSLQFSNPLGGDRWYGNLKSIQLYKTALTDTECITLTTL